MSSIYYNCDMDIKEIIIKEIEKCGLSRYRIAKDVGLSESQLSKLLAGQRALHVDTASRLLTYFGYEIQKKKGRKRK